MKAIWKFPLNVTDVQPISVPSGAKPLAVQVQNGVPCLWAMVDPHAKKATIFVRTFRTGHDVQDDPGEHVGTYQIGALVFHVFAREVA